MRRAPARVESAGQWGWWQHNAQMTSEMEFQLRGEHIALDALLKATGLVASGGDAKAQIVRGGVMINGQVELRRGRKVRAGDAVALGDIRVHVRGSTGE
jgi:ribosome-associated protein